jgi:NAD(P)-dependent dehydrogenase (short-subunit alcohol dehydrogenase family)
MSGTATDGATITAAEVLDGIDLSGKLAVVTGASAGIGREAARVLARAGADVVAGARRVDVLRDLETQAEGGTIYAGALDLQSPDKVRNFAAAVRSLGRPVDILINNGGVMACPLARSDTGLESQFNTNFLGHALLTSELAPELRRSGAARLVSLSSSGHQLSPVVFDDINFARRSYDPWMAYGQSKTACALLAVRAQSQLGPSGLNAFAVHPGVVPGTELAHSVREEDWAAVRERTSAANAPRIPKSVEAGAATMVWAATAAALTGRGPAYLEDCAVAPLIETPNYRFGVRAYALDPEAADQLWAHAERLLRQPLPL